MIYKCECGQVHDNGVSRRHFLGLGAGAVFGYALTHFAHPIEAMASDNVGDDITPRALNLVIINMNGGPSHCDLFDAKSNAESSIRVRPDTEEDRMQVQRIPGADFLWPMGLLGELGQHANKMVSVPVQYWSEAHEIGQYLVYTGMDRNPAFQGERPHIGSVVAAEMVRQNRRRDTDVLPGFVSLNGLPYQNGFLSGMFAPFIVSANRNGLGGVLNHPEGEARFNDRYRLISDLDSANRSANPPLGKPVADMRDFYNATKRMMYNRQVDETFKFTQEDQIRYSPIADPNGNGFGNACIVARNLLKAKNGTRVINIITGGWDQHDQIYRNLFGTDPARPNGNARQLSKGLSELIKDIKATPGERPGNTLFDETLIMCIGDFGRTPAALYRTGNGINNTNGRDHYRIGAVLLAGGALNGGRQIGATDESGRDIIDAGWDMFARTTRRPRNVGGYPAAGNVTRVEDVYYSVYKALGIDPATTYTGTPSGRPYQLVYGGGEIFNEIPMF